MLGFQVHHIFPEALMKDLQKRYTNFFKDIGFDFNDYSNRINLFDNQTMADVMKAFHILNRFMSAPNDKTLLPTTTDYPK